MEQSAHNKQIALIVLDGWGHREDTSDNAIMEAKTPFFDSLIAEYPHTTLDASEENVGLPSGQIGNSEVGHMTIGAGRIIDTDLTPAQANAAADLGEVALQVACVAAQRRKRALPEPRRGLIWFLTSWK